MPKVPQRLHDGLGKDLRLLISLRSPAARAYSHYRHNVAQFRESRSFAEVVENEAMSLVTGKRDQPPFGYLGRGLYAEQIERYLDKFPTNQCHFISFEAMTQRQSSIMQSIYSFLGVAPFKITSRFRQGGRPLATYNCCRATKVTKPS
nr:sulfotransferase domain-containing protein [Sphingopyxis sp. BSNA05]